MLNIREREAYEDQGPIHIVILTNMGDQQT